MTEEEIRGIFGDAKLGTSAKEAELTLIVKDGATWLLLFQSGGEELAIRVEETPDSTPEGLREEIRHSLMQLF